MIVCVVCGDMRSVDCGLGTQSRGYVVLYSLYCTGLLCSTGQVIALIHNTFSTWVFFIIFIIFPSGLSVSLHGLGMNV